jgi:hypothetical protein
MNRMAWAVVGLVTLVSSSARASCAKASGCFCPVQPSVVAIAITESTDGGTALLRVESSTLGLDAGAQLTRSSEAGEVAGARWLVFEAERTQIDSEGRVTCQFANQTLLAQDVATAAAGTSCEQDLTALGFTQPPCNDVVRCSVSPTTLGSAGLLAWLLSGTVRRRRHQ